VTVLITRPQTRDAKVVVVPGREIDCPCCIAPVALLTSESNNWRSLSTLFPLPQHLEFSSGQLTELAVGLIGLRMAARCLWSHLMRMR